MHMYCACRKIARYFKLLKIHAFNKSCLYCWTDACILCSYTYFTLHVASVAVIWWWWVSFQENHSNLLLGRFYVIISSHNLYRCRMYTIATRRCQQTIEFIIVMASNGETMYHVVGMKYKSLSYNFDY